MAQLIRVLTGLLIISGCFGLTYLSAMNKRLAVEVNRLEAELGKLSITDANRVYVAEVKRPEVPPEVAPYIVRIWQFRCYLPPSYDAVKASGGGRVTNDGLYQSGGFGSSWSAASPNAIHKLLTVSFQKTGSRIQAFYSFNGTSGTTSWGVRDPERFDAMVVQKLVSSEQGSRSFDQDAILQFLKIYDPDTAEDKQIAGKSLTTYEGGQFVLCPRSRETFMTQLREGVTPGDFNPDWLATAVVDE